MRLLRPDWPTPPGVVACVTGRDGGVSRGAFASLNLGSHVGDLPAAVEENRRRLREQLGLASAPAWLAQVHGVEVVEQRGDGVEGSVADACWTREPGVVCAVLTADCLPVLFASRDGSVVAAAHAGWRGLAAGVLEQTVAALGVEPKHLVAWLGPAIGPCHFEVGPELRAAFVERHADALHCFRAGADDRLFGDLFALARLRLARAGVDAVHGGGICTACDDGRWFSHRRDTAAQGGSGRFASLIWKRAAG